MSASVIQQWWKVILMKRQEEYLNYMMLESIRKDAALKIQSSYRGMIGRRLFSEAQQHFEEEAMESLRHDSATMLQASFRGYRDRKIIQEETAQKENNHKQNIAATKLQASFRGIVTELQSLIESV